MRARKPLENKMRIVGPEKKRFPAESFKHRWNFSKSYLSIQLDREETGIKKKKKHAQIFQNNIVECKRNKIENKIE